MSDKPNSMLVSSAQLARLLACTDRTVRRLARSGVLPRVGKGRNDKFDAFACVPRFVDHVRRGEEGSSDLAEARLRLAEAQRREIEQRTRRASRELVPLDEVATLFEAAMVGIGSQLDGLPGRLANELALVTEPAHIRRTLFDETRRIRNAAADQLEALSRDSAGSEGTPSATGKDSGHVG